MCPGCAHRLFFVQGSPTCSAGVKAAPVFSPDYKASCCGCGDPDLAPGPLQEKVDQPHRGSAKHSTPLPSLLGEGQN